jgi:hypothetical protein
MGSIANTGMARLKAPLADCRPGEEDLQAAQGSGTEEWVAVERDHGRGQAKHFALLSGHADR